MDCDLLFKATVDTPYAVLTVVPSRSEIVQLKVIGVTMYPTSLITDNLDGSTSLYVLSYVGWFNIVPIKQDAA